MKVGDKKEFVASCGTRVQDIIVEVNECGYVVKGDNAKSNLHDDGLFRFTFM